MSKVLVVNPPRFHGIPVIREDRCENADRDCVQTPTSLVYITGILRSLGHTVRLLDANGYNMPKPAVLWQIHKFKPDWVVFRSTVSTFEEDTKVADYAKMEGAKSILLNWNLHGVSEEDVLKKCPSLTRYLGLYHYEYVIPQIIDGEEHPKPKFTEDIPDPPWGDLPNFDPYFMRTKWLKPWVVVRGSKGCGWRCAFCVDQSQRLYKRSPELIGDELEYLVNRGVKYISFFDDTWESDENWSMNIIKQIEDRQLKFRWYINSRSDMIVRRGLAFFKRARKAGLDGSSFGIEFGTDEMLKRVKKDTTVAINTEATQILHKAGIKSYASLMMGYLGETKEQMMETANWVRRVKPTAFQINPVYPIFGTTLWAEAESMGLIDKSKLDWKGLACVPTGLMDWKFTEYSPQELYKIRRQMYRKIYFSSWALYNLLKWSWRNPELTLGYGISMLGRMRNGFTFSH